MPSRLSERDPKTLSIRWKWISSAHNHGRFSEFMMLVTVFCCKRELKVKMSLLHPWINHSVYFCRVQYLAVLPYQCHIGDGCLCFSCQLNGESRQILSILFDTCKEVIESNTPEAFEVFRCAMMPLFHTSTFQPIMDAFFSELATLGFIGAIAFTLTCVL